MRLRSRVLCALVLLVGITACSGDRTPVSVSDDQAKSLLLRSPESKYGKSEVDSNTRVVVDGLARALARELATA